MKLTNNQKIGALLTGGPGKYRSKAAEERGQRMLQSLRESVEASETDAEHSLKKEYWVRNYLGEHAAAYGIDIEGDLDKEVRGTRGDYRIGYQGQKMILEVEKDLKFFFKHDHSTSGPTGWTNHGSIDIVFAATDKNDRREDLDIPVIIASDIDRSEIDAPTFEDWHNWVKDIKSKKEAFVLTLLSSIYWEHAKGSPTVREIERLEGEVDPASREYLTALHNVLWTCLGTGVGAVLFHREVSIKEEEDFTDLKRKATSIVKESFDQESEWDCPKCSAPLVEVGTDKWVYDTDPEGMTDGQLAEQIAAEQGGPFEEGIHGETLTVLYCFDCLVGGVVGLRDSGPMLFDNQSETNFSD